VPSDSAEPRLYVFRLQNAKAVDVAAVLNDVFSGAKANAGSGGDRTADLQLGTNDSDETIGINAHENGAATGNGVDLRVGDNLKIIPDENNNGLVILATPKEYELVIAAVRKLDLIPLQVLIEATIIEVTLNDTLAFGVEWFFKNSVGGSKTGQALLDLGDARIGTLAPSFSYAIINSNGLVRAAINALATESEVSVLSSPSLMVLDNQTATINVGDEIPIPTRSSISNIDPNAPTVNEIEYRNTGVTLQVTPRVNAGGLVTMDLDQEVSDAISTTSSTLNAPTIQQRKITSTVAVQSGETIVLGGLIQNTATEGESGIPYLRNIPVVGKLFSQTNDSKRRTELIVLITPRAVGDDNDAREVTREYSERMKSFEPPSKSGIRY
ncbi:MAG TPA: type II secretion system protein GspD, partial [Gammaproteobacteria bacterium]|nr:type II secretion system protein GspD [Gammaproteobacteria bacterium]